MKTTALLAVMLTVPGVLPAQNPGPGKPGFHLEVHGGAQVDPADPELVLPLPPPPPLDPPPAPATKAPQAPATPPVSQASPDEEKVDEHKSGSEKLGTRQDELAGDVQQLALEQTVQKVIDLLKDCEDTMGETSERLTGHDTGGDTIAAQTEIIEKILDAAKEKQKQGSGGGKAGGAMMDMLQQMAGKGEGESKEGSKEGQAGDKGGFGKTGLSDSANTGNSGGGTGERELRRVPKAAGTAGKALPEEFRGALDAYNRGADKLAK